MAITQTYLDNILCRAKDCYSELSYRATKNRKFGEDDDFYNKMPYMKKLYSLIYVLKNEYCARFCDCTPCSCNGEEYSGDPNDLSCKEACLTDDQVCFLYEKIKLICDSVSSSCN